MELRPGHCALASGLPVQSEHLSQLVLPGGSRSVNLVAEDEDGTVAQLLVSQQRLQLHFALAEPGPVAAVHQEHDGVHSWEIIFPHPPGLVMATKIKGGESRETNLCSCSNCCPDLFHSPNPVDGELL